MPSEINRALGRGKKKGLSHKEIMHKRHLKRRKKEAKNNKDRKFALLKEYQELNKVEYSSKKNTSMAIMELVEDVKEKIPSGVYLDIMNQLMALNKEQETLSPFPHRNYTIHGSSAFEDDSEDDDFILNYFREQYYYDRQGDRDNIIRENTINDYYTEPQNRITRINREDAIIRGDTTTLRDTTIRGNWRRTGQGSWVPREGVVEYGSGNMDDYSF
jgi:hypothetical protein